MEVGYLYSGIASFSAKRSHGGILYVPLEKLLYKKTTIVAINNSSMRAVNEHSQVRKEKKIFLSYYLKFFLEVMVLNASFQG